MLYDPKWEVNTKADPMQLGTLIAWLEKRPASKGYSYTCNGHCLLAQYFTAMGMKNVFMWAEYFYHGDKPIFMDEDEAVDRGIATRLPPNFNKIAVHDPMTFGAALERARAARPS